MLVPGVGAQGEPGTGYVTVPLNTGDIFKKEMGNLLEDPLGVAKQVDQFLGPDLYTWTIYPRNSIYYGGTRYDQEGRYRLWDQQHQVGPTADQKRLLVKPNWNNQDPGHQTHMADLRMIIIQGIRESVPRGQNINNSCTRE